MSRPTALVGFMGAGKSTVGRLFADERGVPFADADAVLEAEAGRSIPELFAHEGESTFRARERAVVGRLLAEGGAGVVALGGGAVGDPATRELLARCADVVWLDVDADTAWTRVAATGATRPLARDESAFRQLQRAGARSTPRRPTSWWMRRPPRARRRRRPPRADRARRRPGAVA